MLKIIIELTKNIAIGRNVAENNRGLSTIAIPPRMVPAIVPPGSVKKRNIQPTW
jgi:hypothetical protein